MLDLAARLLRELREGLAKSGKTLELHLVGHSAGSILLGGVADKIGRAYGVLRHAWIIDSKEALNHLSLLRLGGDLGFLPQETVKTCDALLMDIQPAHLQLHSGRKLSPVERDAIRAEIVRSRLQSLEAPDIRSTRRKNGNDPDPEIL